MPRPGVEVLIVDGAPAGSAILNTGTAFMAGVSERGPVGTAVKVTSLKSYRATFGERAGGSVLSDSVATYFSEGGGDLYVSRVSGDTAVAASGDLGTSVSADAVSPGEWGNKLKLELVAATAPLTGFVLVVSLDGKPVEKSSAVATPDALVGWASSRSEYVSLSALAGPLAAGNVTLTGGADDPSADPADVAAALATFDSGFGPGQVLAPGFTDDATHEALCAHADLFRRVALLDAPDSADALDLANAATALYEAPGVRMASLWAPWAVYPAEVSPATVTVPYSAVEAGIIARVDRAGNPNAPAAGADGVARLAVGLAQSYTDAERTALNEIGVDLAKVVYGDVRSYGYRTVAGPDESNWLWFGNSRTLMAVAWECEAVAETYVLKQIDGRRQIFSRLNKDLRGVCARYFDLGALYGETQEEAFSVDTSEAVNTIDTIKRGEIHAVVRARVSPAAEWVVIEIVKVPVEQPVAA